MALAERFPHVYAAVGIHPSDCGGCGETEFEEIEALCRHEKVVAIGEIGLDYYWKENPPRELQQKVFRRQMELAQELQLPVIIHDREAHQDCLSIVREYPQVTRSVPLLLRQPGGRQGAGEAGVDDLLHRGHHL